MIQTLKKDLLTGLPDLVAPAKVPPKTFVETGKSVYSVESYSLPSSWVDHMAESSGRLDRKRYSELASHARGVAEQ